MNPVTSTPIKVTKDSRAGLERITFSAVVNCPGDLFEVRECKVRLKESGGLGFHRDVLHFDFCPPQYGGMAYREVLLAYSELFAAAARYIGGPELDFQI